MIRRTARAAALLLVIPLLGTAPAAGGDADAPADSLEAHAREALGRFNEARRSPDLREDVRAELLGAADPLAAAGRDSLAAVCLDCAGILSFSSGRIDEAQEAWTRALARAEACGDPGLEVRCLNSRAVGFAVSGDYERAGRMFRAQIPLREEIGDAQSLGTVWANLGGTAKALGRIPEAIEADERALRYHRESGDPRGLSGVYGALAELLAAVDNLPRALVWADSSIAIARRHELGDALANGLMHRSFAEIGEGRWEDALASLDEAVAVLTESRNTYYRSWGRVARGRPLIQLERGEEFLVSMREARDAGETIEDPVLLSQARTLEGIALLETGHAARAESVLAGAARDLDAHRATLRDEASIEAAAESRTELDAAWARCLLRRGEVERAWAIAEHGSMIRHRGLADGAPDASLDELVVALRAERAALVHLLDPQVGARIVFRITGDGLTVRESASDVMLRPLLRPVLDLLASGADDDACAPALERLAAALLPDLVDGLPDDIDRLYVVAPGPLSGFPLEALPLRAADGTVRPLGERWLVAYQPAATTWLELRHRGVTGQGLVAFADPVTGTGSGDDADDAAIPRIRRLRETPLPHARDEARSIAKGDARLLVGAEATVAGATGTLARDAAVLHFATHADVNPLRAERSALVLSDGVLDADAIRQLPLHADLVTLSGCRTSGGYALLGEGSLGLARAFVRAGAQSVVGSAWDVEDRAAREFMTSFYGALRDGRARDEALRETRRAMAAAGFPPRDRYAFVLVGVGPEPVRSLTRDGGAVGRRRALAGLLLAAAVVVIIGARRRRASA